MNFINLAGNNYGRWTVIKRIPSASRDAVWQCRCACGKLSSVDGASLRRGDTKSCGCLRKEGMTTHGQSMGKQRKFGYGIWSGIKSRCENTRVKEYASYGGRGIQMCERWSCSFDNFIQDMGKRPSRRHSIDRIDNDGDYEPGNCHWATRDEQGQNRSNNVRVVYLGRDMTIRNAVNIAGNVALLATAKWRVKHGWSVERAVETPSPESVIHNVHQFSI